MTTTVATTVMRSFADIVKGKSTQSTKGETRMKPGARGSLLCPCRGEVLAMLSHYGWLMVYGAIDHPSVEKHDGHVYVHKDDVMDGEELSAGDIVSFYLYVDGKGLGAEECCLEKRKASQFNLTAAEFVPSAAKVQMSADAQEFVPSWSAQSIPEHVGEDNVPRSAGPAVLFGWSQAFMSDDDESDDEIGSASTPRHQEVDKDSCCSDSSAQDLSSKKHLLFHAPWKVKRSASPDASTSAGSSSDSEDDHTCDAPVLQGGVWSFERGRFHVSTRLPPNFRPPPGLTLAVGRVVAD